MERKYGAHFQNAVPNLDLDPVVLIGDAFLPPVLVSDVEVPMPCGKGEIQAALNRRGVTIPNDERQNALLDELQAEIVPLAKKMSDILAKRQAAKK
jgi:hypothetical protein